MVRGLNAKEFGSVGAECMVRHSLPDNPGTGWHQAKQTSQHQTAKTSLAQTHSWCAGFHYLSPHCTMLHQQSAVVLLHHFGCDLVSVRSILILPALHKLYYVAFPTRNLQYTSSTCSGLTARRTTFLSHRLHRDGAWGV